MSSVRGFSRRDIPETAQKGHPGRAALGSPPNLDTLEADGERVALSSPRATPQPDLVDAADRELELAAQRVEVDGRAERNRDLDRIRITNAAHAARGQLVQTGTGGARHASDDRARRLVLAQRVRDTQLAGPDRNLKLTGAEVDARILSARNERKGRQRAGRSPRHAAKNRVHRARVRLRKQNARSRSP